MTRRYYVPDLPADGGTIALPTEEAVHAARVMRVKTGDAVVIFDGVGREAAGQICSVERREVYVEVQPAAIVSREPQLVIEVAVSLPKGDRAKLLIEKLTELGVARISPIICHRTQAGSAAKSDTAKRDGGTSVSEKLSRYVVEASKQCERNRLMEVARPRSLAEHLEHQADGQLKIIAHPQGQSLGGLLAAQAPKQVSICIGPEGGFTEDEIQQAIASGWQAVSLGPRILRVETAATALVSRLVID